MRVGVVQAEPTELDVQLLVLGLFVGEELPASLAAAPGAADARGRYKRLTRLHPGKPAHALVVGLGKREEMSAEKARVAAAIAAREASSLDASTVAWIL